MGWHKIKTYWMFLPGGALSSAGADNSPHRIAVASERPVVTLRHAHLRGLGGGVAH